MLFDFLFDDLSLSGECFIYSQFYLRSASISPLHRVKRHAHECEALRAKKRKPIAAKLEDCGTHVNRK